MNAPPLNQQRLLERYFAESIKYNPSYPVVVSEGDSWFSYPGHWNTIDHLDHMVENRMSLLRLEHSGDTIGNMLGGQQRGLLRSILQTYPVDVLLFSGGGNDVVGHELVDFFSDVSSPGTWRQHIQPALESQFDMIRTAFETLIALRNQYRPEAVIITHGYAYAQPSGAPTVFWLWPVPLKVKVGPWIRNNLASRNITSEPDQHAVVTYLIDRFNELLADLAKQHDRFVVVDNRGRLTPTDWADELHPTRDAFRRVAGAFLAELRRTCPKFR